MKNVYSYDVSLNNSDCIFDSRDGFASISDACDWACGRGSSYGVTITKIKNGLPAAEAHLIAVDNGKSTSFMADNFGQYVFVKKEDIKNYMYTLDPAYL